MNVLSFLHLNYICTSSLSQMLRNYLYYSNNPGYGGYGKIGRYCRVCTVSFGSVVYGGMPGSEVDISDVERA